MAKITQQQLIGLLSKLTPQTIVTKAVVGKAKDIATEKFGYDFLGLGLRLLVFFIVAFLIEQYFKAKIAVDDLFNPTSPNVVNPKDISSGTAIGLGDFLWKAIFGSWVRTVTVDETGETVFEPKEPVSGFFRNEAIRAVFSEEGYHGFHYWDIIKIIALLLVVMEWRRFSAMTKATGGQVQPLTHGLFILFIVGLGLSIIPQFVAKIKHSYINPQAMT